MDAHPAQQVIEGLRANREVFERFCRTLTEEELARPVPPDNKWTVRDFIIHSVMFDDLTTNWVKSVIGGNTGAPASPDGSPFDIDAWNQDRVEQWRGRPVDEAFAAAAPERARFEGALGRLTQEQMQAVVDFPGDNKRDPAKVPFGLFLGGLVRHDPIHTVDMLKALPERAEDPELKAWTDDRMVEWYQKAMSGPPKR
jgi:hypothetical protein